MPNPPRLDLVYKAIRAGIFGQIEWKSEAENRVLDDPEMQLFSTKTIRGLLREFVRDGGQIEVRNQRFELWLQEDPDNPYWYRAVIPVPEFPQGLFVELIITEYDEQDPWVLIVSSHPQK